MRNMPKEDRPNTRGTEPDKTERRRWTDLERDTETTGEVRETGTDRRIETEMRQDMKTHDSVTTEIEEEAVIERENEMEVERGIETEVLPNTEITVGKENTGETKHRTGLCKLKKCFVLDTKWKIFAISVLSEIKFFFKFCKCTLRKCK